MRNRNSSSKGSADEWVAKHATCQTDTAKIGYRRVQKGEAMLLNLRCPCGGRYTTDVLPGALADVAPAPGVAEA